MLRVGKPEDYEIVVGLCDSLAKETPYKGMFKNFRYTPEFHYVVTNPQTQNQRMGLILLEGEEAIGIALFDKQPMFDVNHDTFVARLTMMYIKPEYRKQGRMEEVKQALEHWARLVGAKYTCVGHKWSGYKKMETIYMKELK